ncbi:MAG: hypothetical protein J2P37_01865 [Ktedonobacteraceae bacterium]|nr:hypothetical protein [Ktedonobacteraceae bacterium]
MQPTIAYREYVNYKGVLKLACSCTEEHSQAEVLADLLTQINYLGKRGGFLQIMAPPQMSYEQPAGQFIHLTAEGLQLFGMEGTLQMLDDCGPSLTFAKANIYHDAKMVLHKDRVLRHIVVPYRQTRSSRSYSWYQRLLV